FPLLRASTPTARSGIRRHISGQFRVIGKYATFRVTHMLLPTRRRQHFGTYRNAGAAAGMLFDCQLGVAYESRIDVQACDSHIRAPMTNLGILRDLDAAEEYGRPLHEVSRLVHSDPARGVDPELALHQPEPFLSRRDPKNIR